MKKILGILAVIAVAVNAQATITLNIDAEALKDQSGTRIPENSGLVLIVADTTQNGFASSIAPGQSLALGAFLGGGDDQIVGKYRVESGGFGDGDFEVAFGASLAGGWGAGDGVALYWFSDATTATASAAGGMHYNSNVSTKDANWVTPSDGASVNMSWFTTDAGDLGSGSVAAEAGNASLVVVPEPSSVMLVGLGLLGMISLIRRRS